MVELREVEVWNNRCCNECGSEEQVLELVVGADGKRGSAIVVALCSECRDKLLDSLLENRYSKKTEKK